MGQEMMTSLTVQLFSHQIKTKRPLEALKLVTLKKQTLRALFALKKVKRTAEKMNGSLSHKVQF